ncbi:hypothetical protein SAMN04488134_108168 [Amphibacillus marinus]|uniref:PDZ domain-containing protein n=1 Tax=Amphibacillus marinus TaxID=872970 RepID=A0A1H8QHW9_9BACI|nr:PDZ domain-containing protein [Amphibacillus marinus]SEO53626.1 hypothetical protein SAMN04488134_108168 [Amphibacillus marinus]
MEVWLIEIAKACLRLIVNPLLYWFLLIVFLASQMRIKRERKSFGHKIYPMFDELYGFKLKGLAYGCLFSLIVLVLGATLHYLMLIGIITITMLFSLNKKFTFLSSAYIFGFTAIILLLFPYYQSYLPVVLQGEVTNLHWIVFTTLMGAFLVIEAAMVNSIRPEQTFPELIRGYRGKYIGQHRLKRIALIPLVMLWPIGDLVVMADWWPVLEINNQTYGLLIFPFIIGFEHVVKSSLPEQVTGRLSQYLLMLGLLVIATSLIGYYYAIFSLISVIVGLAGREWLAYRLKVNEQHKNAMFMPSQDGIKVLAIMPGSPAVDMELVVGDTIVKVNGMTIGTPNDFYEALQVNLTLCKLDVVDQRGEIRFLQRPLYQGDHHELGVIFAVDHQDRLA